MTASFAWPNANLLCGQCHYVMDSSVSKNDIPVEYRAKCINQKCVNFGKIFRVPSLSAIQLEEIQS